MSVLFEYTGPLHDLCLINDLQLESNFAERKSQNRSREYKAQGWQHLLFLLLSKNEKTMMLPFQTSLKHKQTIFYHP